MVGGTHRFGTQWSMLVRMTTAVVILAAIVVVAVVLRMPDQAGSENESGSMWVLPIAFLPVAILSIAILFAPLGYAVGPVGVIVHRMGPNVYIRHEDIAHVERVERGRLGLGLCVFGSSGFFGYFGWFYGPQVGWFRAFATNGADLVLVTLHDGRKLAMSPYPPDVFVEWVREARP